MQPPLAATLDPSRALPWQRWCDAAFWLAAAAFLTASVVLAAVNRSPGSQDSEHNLDVARNLVLGRGYQSSIVPQLFEPQPLPGPEAIRPPGVPFLIAGLFRLFGISLAIQVVVNAVTVLLAAWLLRWAIRTAGGAWFGNVAGILFFLSGNYEVQSIWSNNLLVLCTVGLLAIAARVCCCGGLPRGTATLGAMVAAAGFLTKPTFVATAVFFAAVLFLVAPPAGVRWRQRLLGLAWFFALLAAMTAPYWVYNLRLYGTPVYSPQTACRLSLHFNDTPHGYSYSFRWDNPESMSELLERHGLLGLLEREAALWGRIIFFIGRLNFPLVVLALGAVVLAWRSTRWKDYLLPLAAMAEPILAPWYHHAEFRYLWPIYPCCLYLIGLAVRDGLFASAAEPKESVARVGLAPLDPAYGCVKKYGLVAFGATLALAVPVGVHHARVPWLQGFNRALQAPPAWVEVVRAIPEDAVVMTDNPYTVAWHTQRLAVCCPGGPREHLLCVARAYGPTYFLHTGSPRNCQLHGELAFGAGELRPIAAGQAPEHGRSWQFSAIELDRRAVAAYGAQCPSVAR